MSGQEGVIRAQVQVPQLDYESLTWDDVHLSAWAISLVRASGETLRYLSD